MEETVRKPDWSPIDNPASHLTVIDNEQEVTWAKPSQSTNERKIRKLIIFSPDRPTVQWAEDERIVFSAHKTCRTRVKKVSRC